jgi:hypothetical protein
MEIRNGYNIPLYTNIMYIDNINIKNYIWHWDRYKIRWINNRIFGIEIYKNGKK